MSAAFPPKTNDSNSKLKTTMTAENFIRDISEYVHLSEASSMEKKSDCNRSRIFDMPAP
jgi:hypothetical protein